MSTLPLTHTLGYPRIGAHRELKKVTEAYWKGQLTELELLAAGQAIRRQNWLTQLRAGIDLIPSNDFSFYDQVLDLSCLVGNIPKRFGWTGGHVDLATQFAVARGVGPEQRTSAHPSACSCSSCGPTADVAASELTKWFDTNYHYIVPEFAPDTRFALASTKIFDEFSEALALGIRTKPILIGPVTYLMLGKVYGAERKFDPLQLLDRLLPIYVQVLDRLAALGAEWIQFDEPVFALDLNKTQRQALALTYATLRAVEPNLRLMVATYFGELRDNRRDFLRLPVDAFHVDLTRGSSEFDAIARELPPTKCLSLGLIDGRNIWRFDSVSMLPLLEKAMTVIGPERLLVAPSCSLLHVPVTLQNEPRLDPEIKPWLAFAEEKLAEVVAVQKILGGHRSRRLLAASHSAVESRRTSARLRRPDVQLRLREITPADLQRRSPFPERDDAQRARLALPLLPTTTIGSFPQTEVIRAVRARWRRHELDEREYDAFLEREIRQCVRFQEQVGLDVLVHGEFERNDMVEYFAEQLDGFAFTANGWVQSYGSRCVKPPIIYGDVARRGPMTVRWATFAQSLTPKPVKGMLTGPVTLLQWSFVRDDQPRRETALQLSLALRDEVLELERAGIAVIQIDEPALREGLPLRKSDWPAYLGWAVGAFRLAAAGVRDDTQIHTHMCYAEFNDIIAAIAALDADVITIETSRSKMELLNAFADFDYPNQIGPGVYDIHSPHIPAIEEMATLIEHAAAVIPIEHLWVNPDCGLKTRGWREVKAALSNLVACAHEFRARIARAHPDVSARHTSARS